MASTSAGGATGPGASSAVAPRIYMRKVTPDGLLQRSAFSITSSGGGACAVVSGKKTLATVQRVAQLFAEDVASVAVANQSAAEPLASFVQGRNEVVLVLGLAGSGKSTFLEGISSKTVLGGYLEGVCRALYAQLQQAREAAGSTASLSLSVHEHYSELVKDLLSAKKDKEVNGAPEWNAVACAGMRELTRRTVPKVADALDALGKAKLARSNIKGRSDKTAVVYTFDLDQTLPGGEHLVSSLHVVELFAADRLSVNLDVLAGKEGEAVVKSARAFRKGLDFLERGPVDDDTAANLFDVEMSTLTWLLHPLFEFNAGLSVLAVANTASDATQVATLCGLLNSIARITTYPVPGTAAHLTARRMRRLRELQLKARAEDSLARLSLDGDKDELAKHLISVTRENDALQESIATLSAQVADLQEQLKIGVALKEDTESMLNHANADKTNVAVEAALLRDRLAAATRDADQLRARVAKLDAELTGLRNDLAHTTDVLHATDRALGETRAHVASLEAQLTGTRADLTGEVDQSEDMSLELLRLFKQQSVIERERNAAQEAAHGLRQRIAELEQQVQSMTRDTHRLQGELHATRVKVSRASPSISNEVVAVIQRVEIELKSQLDALRADYNGLRVKHRDLTRAFRSRLQQYVEKTCQLTPATETLTTLKRLMDSMLNDVVVSLIQDEQATSASAERTHSLLQASHELVLTLLRLTRVLQDSRPCHADLDRLLAAHEAFSQELKSSSPPASAKAKPADPAPAVSTDDARAEIARFIAATQQEMEEERSRLLTRAMVAESAAKEWEALAQSLMKGGGGRGYG
ncbi:hypothetical protein H9P43_002947 [Blastocladiella emersonii ATCC 22665]|nr:hypothetical protein H9P43_002947 [Blastocladiella emersonii ATCC 22665]